MDLTKMEQHLRSLGAQADDGRIDAEALPSAPASPAAAASNDANGDAGWPNAVPEGGDDSGGKAPGEQGDTDEPAGSQESLYEKAVRERREMQQRESQQNAQDRAELNATRAELARLRQATTPGAAADGPAAAAADPRLGAGFTAADFEAAARHFGQSGDNGLARAAQQAALAHRQVEGQAQQHAFVRQWWDHVHQAVQETPELRDQSSNLGRAVQGILKENPLFSTRPDGFRQAVTLAKAQRDAAGAGALRSQLETLKRENERLSKLTAITGTSPARSSGEKSNALSERDLRRLAAEHDNE